MKGKGARYPIKLGQLGRGSFTVIPRNSCHCSAKGINIQVGRRDLFPNSPTEQLALFPRLTGQGQGRRLCGGKSLWNQTWVGCMPKKETHETSAGEKESGLFNCHLRKWEIEKMGIPVPKPISTALLKPASYIGWKVSGSWVKGSSRGFFCRRAVWLVWSSCSWY